MMKIQIIQYFNQFFKYFKKPAERIKITAWKYKSLSKESIKPLAISDNLNPGINYNDNGKILSKI